jgi:hypothetical protein
MSKLKELIRCIEWNSELEKALLEFKLLSRSDLRALQVKPSHMNVHNCTPIFTTLYLLTGKIITTKIVEQYLIYLKVGYEDLITYFR